jgi:hypothetical protein
MLYDGSPVQHKTDDSWLGGAIAVQDNGERLLVRYKLLSDYQSLSSLTFLTETVRLFRFKLIAVHVLHKEICKVHKSCRI